MYISCSNSAVCTYTFFEEPSYWCVGHPWFPSRDLCLWVAILTSLALCVTWLIHMCDVTHSYAWARWTPMVSVTWPVSVSTHFDVFSPICDMTHSYVCVWCGIVHTKSPIYIAHDSSYGQYLCTLGDIVWATSVYIAHICVYITHTISPFWSHSDVISPIYVWSYKL